MFHGGSRLCQAIEQPFAGRSPLRRHPGRTQRDPGPGNPGLSKRHMETVGAVPPRSRLALRLAGMTTSFWPEDVQAHRFSCHRNLIPRRADRPVSKDGPRTSKVAAHPSRQRFLRMRSFWAKKEGQSSPEQELHGKSTAFLARPQATITAAPSLRASPIPEKVPWLSVLTACTPPKNMFFSGHRRWSAKRSVNVDMSASAPGNSRSR